MDKLLAAILLMVLSLGLVGCTLIQRATSANTASDTNTNAVRGAVAPLETPQKPVQPSQPAEPISPPPQRPIPTKNPSRPVPDSGIKGAEKLMAAARLPGAHQIESAKIKPQATSDKITRMEETAARTADPVVSVPVVRELIFREPPRQHRFRQPGGNVFVWVALGCCGVILPGAAWLYARRRRRSKSSEAAGAVQVPPTVSLGLIIKHTPEGFLETELKPRVPKPVVVETIQTKPSTARPPDLPHETLVAQKDA
jgi:hypothetical protein